MRWWGTSLSSTTIPDSTVRPGHLEVRDFVLSHDGEAGEIPVVIQHQMPFDGALCPPEVD